MCTFLSAVLKPVYFPKRTAHQQTSLLSVRIDTVPVKTLEATSVLSVCIDTVQVETLEAASEYHRMGSF
jgi:hypothetical protein